MYVCVSCFMITVYWILLFPSCVCSGLSSVLNIIVNRSIGFHDHISVQSLDEFFHSNAWLGACTSISGAIGGQLIGLIADR